MTARAHPDLERHWRGIYAGNEPGGLRRARALRPHLQDPRQHRSHAALHPPRPARHARAFHRLPHRTLRQQLPALAHPRASAHPAIGGEDEDNEDTRKVIDYAREIHAELRAAGVRATIDLTSDPIKAKIAHAEERKVHTMLVLGKRDLDAGNVAVRIHGKGPQGFKPRAEVITDLLAAIKDRRA